MKSTDKKSADKLLKIFYKIYNHFGPLNWWPGDSPFEIMVGAILTQNTSWSNVEKAINNLKKENLLDPFKLLALPDDRLRELIRPSGFYNVKTKRLKEFLNFFISEYQGNIEKMKKEDLWKLRNKLLKIKGVGKETADSILLYALEKPVFVVDAYTRRIFSRCGLVPENIEYDELQEFFMSNLPEDVFLYNEYHAQIVLLGKTYCRKKPLCEKCPLRDESSS